MTPPSSCDSGASRRGRRRTKRAGAQWSGRWEDDCARCDDGSGLRVLCDYCNHVFHPTCLDPPTGVENWDDGVFACGRCVTDAMGKAVSTMGGALEHAGYGSAAMGWRWSMLATAARPWPDAVPALPVPASSLPGEDDDEDEEKAATRRRHKKDAEEVSGGGISRVPLSVLLAGD